MDESTRDLHASYDKLLDKRLPLRDDMQIAKVDKLRSIAKQLAHGIIDVVPAGAEKDKALGALRDALLWAEIGCEVNQIEGLPRITAARIDERTAQQMRDKGSKLPGE
jgi:hypothetical protein